MITELKKHIQELNLFNKKVKLLVGVSGGIDSIVLLDLLSKCEYNCIIAHCNFSLRGKESDTDEQFIKQLAASYQLPFFSKKFDTKKYAACKGISIQMAARELRYDWFENIRKKKDCQYIVIAHNQNDNIETFLINIIRGTGISGLTGIEIKNKFIIRPLLFASREMIREYALDNKLAFREDSSNAETKYTRNKIRHQILPLLKEINPSIENTLSKNIERFKDIEEIYYDAINKQKQQILIFKNDKVYINIAAIQKLSPCKTYLFEFLKNFNFTQHHIDDVIQILDSTSGKHVDSGTHILLKDRKHLIVYPKTENSETIYLINPNTKKIKKPVSLSFEKFNKSIEFTPDRSKHIAFLDFEAIAFPLSIRKWNKGDFFYPLGMNNRKKLSDFFTDEKFTIFEKQNTWLLTSEDKIVWVIGHRIDNRFSISEKTKKILKITIENE